MVKDIMEAKAFHGKMKYNINNEGTMKEKGKGEGKEEREKGKNIPAGEKKTRE